MAIDIDKNSSGEVTYDNPPVSRTLFPNLPEGGTIGDGSITPEKLNSSNSASDGDVLSYNATEEKFEWYDINSDISDIKADFTQNVFYKDTSTRALRWRKGVAINNLGRYATSHPESVGLWGDEGTPYVFAGTTFTVKSGYSIRMAIWSEPVTSNISTDKRLYLTDAVVAGTVTAPIDGYMALAISNADRTAIADNVGSYSFAEDAVSSCVIYLRTVKDEVSEISKDLFTTANDASIWSSGRWAVGNGNESANSKYIKTKKYIPTDYMKDAVGITAKPGYLFIVLGWALDGTYEGSFRGENVFSKSNSYSFNKIMFSNIGGEHKYAINVLREDGADITVEEYTNISFIVPISYEKVSANQGIENAGKSMIVGDDGIVRPTRQQLNFHTDLFNAQKDISDDWHLPFINLADNLMLGANHQIPGTATIWSQSGTTDLYQKGVWMPDGTHPYRGEGLVDMFGRAIANQMQIITPSYHDGSGQSSPSYWSGKRLLWLGTSIPAGSDPEAGEGTGATYPSLVATQLGATVTNIAKGSSMLRIKSSNGSYTGVAYSHFLRAVTRMVSEADALANDWANIYQSIPNASSTLPAEDLQTMKTISFENLVLPYLDGTNTAPDAIVIDYGHNDTATGIDGGKDFWIRPSVDSIASGLLAEDTWMTANNYANLKLALNSDLSGITDLPGFTASLNRNCFVGACNFLITLILRYKPYMRIIFISDYN